MGQFRALIDTSPGAVGGAQWIEEDFGDSVWSISDARHLFQQRFGASNVSTVLRIDETAGMPAPPSTTGGVSPGQAVLALVVFTIFGLIYFSREPNPPSQSEPAPVLSVEPPASLPVDKIEPAPPPATNSPAMEPPRGFAAPAPRTIVPKVDTPTSPQPKTQEAVEVPAKVDPRRPPVEPPYPESARRRRQAGTVTLNLLLDENGRVQDATVSESSGYEILDKSAVDTAKRNWRFIPATRDGINVPTTHRFKVTFRP